MFKKKVTYTNQLTELIKNNPNINVETVFSHEQLSITIRNEAPDFIKYVFPEDELDKDKPELSKFEEVLDYALTNKEYPFDEDNSPYPNLHIINQNAASFLSSPSKKLTENANNDKEKRLYRRLRGFIFDSNNSANSMVAGNFSRIFIMWYTKNPKEFSDDASIKAFYEDNFSIDILIKFCIDNVQELAYAELLERFLTTEFDPDSFDKTRTIVLYEILQRVRDIIGRKIKILELDDSENSATINMNNEYHFFNKKSSKLSDLQPPTHYLERIPLPEYIKDCPGETPRILKSEKEKNHFDTSTLMPVDKKIADGDSSENKLLAYTLINAIWLSANETPSLFEFIQSQQPKDEFGDKKRIIEYLFFIGVFGSSNLMVMSTAFRILNVVINGDPKFEIPPITKEDRKNQLGNDIVDYYAEFVVFDIENLSNLAIFSFPIFYNHVYKELKAEKDSIVVYGLKNIESRYLGPDKKYGKTLKHTTNKKGLTPFVYLTPIVLTEPPLSTELTASYFKILNSIFTERNELLGKLKIELEDEKELERIVERVKDIDEFYLNFISYRFEYPGLEGRFNIFELVEKLFPLNPRVYTIKEEKLKALYKDKEIQKIKNFSKDSRPLINDSIAKIADILLMNSFLSSIDAPKLISDHSPNQPPYFTKKTKVTPVDKEEIEMVKTLKCKLNADDGFINTDRVISSEYSILSEMYLIDLLLIKYSYIQLKSKFNKNTAGPRDDTKPLNGE